MSWLSDQQSGARSAIDGAPKRSMADAMAEDGYTPPAHIEPGKFTRFAAPNKKQSNKAAWCMLFDDCRAGMYGDFVSGEEYFWHESGKSGSELSAEERAAIERARERRRSEIEDGYKRGAALASSYWREASPDGVENHKYITDKKITPRICRVSRDGKLTIPIINIDGEQINAQRIETDGSKKFVYEARVDGGFIPVATTEDKAVIAIGEGYATACTLADHNDGITIVSALNAGNLPKVAKKMREKYPSSRIIIAADDDRNTDGNPGMSAARKAAAKYGCEIISPRWRTDSPASATDFNDLWTAHKDPELLRVIRQRSPDLELLLADEDAEFYAVCRQEWLFDDAIPSASVGVMYGPSGTGKSFVALDLAMCIASGKPWHGFEHGSGRQSSVIYISAEGGRGMRIRKRGWEDQNNTRVPGVKIMPKPYMINEVGGATALMSLIREYITETGERVSAIIIDTLAQTNSGDENSTQDASALIRACTTISQEYNSTVLLVHHTGKDESRGGRGNSAFYANIDFALSLTGGVDTVVRVENTKQKDRQKFADITVHMDEVEISGAVDYKGRPVKTLVARKATYGEELESASRLGHDEEDLIQAYRDIGAPGFVSLDKLKQHYYIMPRIATRPTKAKSRAMADAIEMLNSRGMLTRAGCDISIHIDRQDE